MTLGHHVLLGLSIAALGAAGLRVASLAAPRGLERVVTAAVVVCAAAVIQTLLLGLLALGGSPVALALAAGATWLGARLLLPAPALPPGAEVAAWWRDSGLAMRVGLGALAGMGLAWSVWLLRYPALGIDSIAYHVPEIVAWTHNGTPGSVESIVPELSVGNYPLTNEVLLTWGTAISRSFVFLTLWPPAMLALLAAAGWLGLRSLVVPRLPALLALAALLSTPILTNHQMNGAHTDLPALTWLACCAALCAASVRRPLLLAPAVLAAGLAIGTKTTTAPLALLALAIAYVPQRGRLRPLGRPLALAGAGALAVGSYWYLRDLVDHGSPLWPFLATPWGDDLPRHFATAVTFLDRPRLTLDRIGHDYLEVFAGGIVLLAGAVLAPLVARRREVLGCATATAVAAVLWANAPLTGVNDFPVLDFTALSTLRYSSPALAAAALTLALAARAGPRARGYAVAVLAAATVLGVWQTFDLGFPNVPRATTPLVGAALGALAGFMARPVQLPRGPAARLAAVAVVAAAAGALLVPAANGYVKRHARTGLYDAEIVSWVSSLPGYSDDRPTISIAPVMTGVLAGDRLQHRLELVPVRERCDRVRALPRQQWLVVHRNPLRIRGRSNTQRCLAFVRPTHAGRTFRFYGRVASARRR